MSVEISYFLAMENTEIRGRYKIHASYFLNVVLGTFLLYPLNNDCKMTDVMYLCTRQRVVTAFLSAAGSSQMDSEMSVKRVW